MSNDQSRYELVSRRSLLKGSLLVGSLAFAPGLACASGSSNTQAATSPTTVRNSATTAAGSAKATTTTGKVASGPPFLAGAKLTIAFTYAVAAGGGGGPGGGGPGGGGRGTNPYVAVWIEDANGALVHTIALWFKSSESKYTQELQRWSAGERKYVSAGGKDTTQTISAPTRVPGSFNLVWDGKTDTGAVAAQGDYFVCVETAREHGPYQLVREAITIGAAAFDKTLTPNGEITAASVALVV